MTNRSRGLRERVVRGLAKVGLVWALAVLAALFMASSAAGQSHDAYLLASTGADAAVQASSTFAAPLDVPREAGLALAMLVLALGFVVLVAGSTRGPRQVVPVRRGAPADAGPDSDLPLAMALGLYS